MPPKLLIKQQVLMNSLEMYETCSSRSQVKRRNAIVPQGNDRRLKDGAEASLRRRQ